MYDELEPLTAWFGSIICNKESDDRGVVEGQAIEGHVPAEDVFCLQHEWPSAIDLAVPGMPLGSPRMEAGGQSEPYEVILFTASGGRSAPAIEKLAQSYGV